MAAGTKRDTRGLFIVTGPILGYLIDTQGVHSTLLILATSLTPIVLLVLYFLSIEIRKEEAQTLAGAADTGAKETLAV